jgi:SET domain-containing protein
MSHYERRGRRLSSAVASEGERYKNGDGLYQVTAVPRIDESRCWFDIEVRRSHIHRWGVFAMEPIPARRRVIEYTGEKIDADEHERRSIKRYIYIFSLNDKWAVDPVVGGSGAEYINHSCDGNLESFTYGGRIYLSSKRRIEAGEELTYDYHLKGEYNAPCRCGTENCRGWLQGEGED